MKTFTHDHEEEERLKEEKKKQDGILCIHNGEPTIRVARGMGRSFYSPPSLYFSSTNCNYSTYPTYTVTQ